MIRNWYLLILFAGCAAFSAAQANHLDITRPSRDRYPFLGPVKKVTEEYNYEMSDRKYKEVREYDEAGNLSYRKKWNYKDELTDFVTNSFNETGLFIGQRVEDIRDKTTNDYAIVVNTPTRQIAYKCKITDEIEIVSYNDDGFSIGTTIKRKGTKMVPLYKYKRDDNNIAITYTRYDEDGRVKYVSSYKRDAENRAIKVASNYKREKRKSFSEYEYLAVDKYGNWTQRLLKNASTTDGKTKTYEKFTQRDIEYYE